MKYRMEHYQHADGPPKYPHVKVLIDAEPVHIEEQVPFIMDCLNAMQAAGVLKNEREAFIDAVFNALILEAVRWVTLAEEVPGTG